MSDTEQHPAHDELVFELKLWYTRSMPEMGYQAEERRFGYYQRQRDTGRVRATVRNLAVREVPEFLEDLGRYSGEERVRFHVDDRDLDERLGPALVVSGCVREVSEVYLAHVGTPPSPSSKVEGLTIEAVGEDDIEEAVRTERMGFASSEDEPAGEEFHRRVTLREAEARGKGRFLLARISGEPIGLYRPLGFTDEVYWRREYGYVP